MSKQERYKTVTREMWELEDELVNYGVCLSIVLVGIPILAIAIILLPVFIVLTPFTLIYDALTPHKRVKR